jgi:exopolysaccharide production protein ExoQ
MNPSVASLIFACGIAGLYYLDRDKDLKTSKVLWIPVVWLWLIGSRGPTIWLGVAPSAGTDTQLDGTPLDRIIYFLIIAVGVVALVLRGSKVLSTIRKNVPLVLYFGFCLLSSVWSDFPDVSAKRWVKAIGDAVMVLIVVTDSNPIGAFRRLISRVGFLLLPASVLLIKYYPGVGRFYDAWHGFVINTGVSTNKNMLGVIVFVITLGTFWRVLTILKNSDLPDRRRHLIAQVVLLGFGVRVLILADSETSKACFALGACLLVVTTVLSIGRRAWVVHAVALIAVLVGADVMLLGGGRGLVHAMGRNSDLGRTQIWEEVIPMNPNAIVGAGFESFWLGPRLHDIQAANPGNPLNEAHNGYIEIYLNLGIIGLCLIAVILITGYWKAVRVFRDVDRSFGGLLVAYVVTGTIYSITEAGFRTMGPNWIFLQFAIIGASVFSSRTVALVGEGKNVVPALAPQRIGLSTAKRPLPVGFAGRNSLN